MKLQQICFVKLSLIVCFRHIINLSSPAQQVHCWTQVCINVSQVQYKTVSSLFLTSKNLLPRYGNDCYNMLNIFSTKILLDYVSNPTWPVGNINEFKQYKRQREFASNGIANISIFIILLLKHFLWKRIDTMLIKWTSALSWFRCWQATNINLICKYLF